MEEIIGLLVILAISIFKGVSKKLEQSGKQTAGKSPVKPVPPAPVQETFENPFDIKKWIAEAMQEAEAESGMQLEQEPDHTAVVEEAVVSEIDVVPAAEPVMPKVVKPAKPVVMPPVEEEKKTDKEKIDPKKLIIYSEIMTPKCMSNN